MSSLDSNLPSTSSPIAILANIRVVLCRTTHPGNIGAVARAMKTMGLSRLHLVAPARFPSPEASAMAAGAIDVLDDAVIDETLAQAVQDCHLVVGSSARARRIEWPTLSAEEGARRLVAAAREGTRSVAVVFGQERTGLTNEELDLCHSVVSLPANPDYPSLNIAGAVQVLTYELMLAALEAGVSVPESGNTDAAPASHEQMDLLYRHLEEVLVEIDFLDPANPRFLMRRLKRLFNRSGLDQNEINILRGILTAVQRKRSAS